MGLSRPSMACFLERGGNRAGCRCSRDRVEKKRHAWAGRLSGRPDVYVCMCMCI